MPEYRDALDELAHELLDDLLVLEAIAVAGWTNGTIAPRDVNAWVCATRRKICMANMAKIINPINPIFVESPDG
jgi:hypothetical protein